MPVRLSEERIHKELTDPQLEQADWYLRIHARLNVETPFRLPRCRIVEFAAHRRSYLKIVERPIVEAKRNITSPPEISGFTVMSGKERYWSKYSNYLA